MFFWEIYEISRTGFTRNTRECWLLQLVVAGKCFDQKIFFRKYLIRFDIKWHMLPGIKCITEVSRPFTMFILVCTWFVGSTFLCALFIWTSSNVTSIVSITKTSYAHLNRGSINSVDMGATYRPGIVGT